MAWQSAVFGQRNGARGRPVARPSCAAQPPQPKFVHQHMHPVFVPVGRRSKPARNGAATECRGGARDIDGARAGDAMKGSARCAVRRVSDATGNACDDTCAPVACRMQPVIGAWPLSSVWGVAGLEQAEAGRWRVLGWRCREQHAYARHTWRRAGQRTHLAFATVSGGHCKHSAVHGRAAVGV